MIFLLICCLVCGWGCLLVVYICLLSFPHKRRVAVSSWRVSEAGEGRLEIFIVLLTLDEQMLSVLDCTPCETVGLSVVGEN